MFNAKIHMCYQAVTIQTCSVDLQYLQEQSLWTCCGRTCPIHEASVILNLSHLRQASCFMPTMLTTNLRYTILFCFCFYVCFLQESMRVVFNLEERKRDSDFNKNKACPACIPASTFYTKCIMACFSYKIKSRNV